jgi:(1->4)-alpha-D-glucan 1-alpha-D-glucosylmutase
MEMFLYQVLIGAWPFEEKDIPGFKERIKSYMVKVAREAKVHTDWLSPIPKYEKALISFVDSLFEPAKKRLFIKDFLAFVNKVSFYGALNSLVLVLLKITSPGIPDFYQGNELWDFSLVDPDNRRPVDFEKRTIILSDMIKVQKKGQKPPIELLLSSWQDGRIKLYLTYKTLEVRGKYHDLFKKGDYLPFSITGKRRDNIVAFARYGYNQSSIVLVPRLTAGLVAPGVFPIGREVWEDDYIILPTGFPRSWYNPLSCEYIETNNGRLSLFEAFGKLPVSLLLGKNIQ